MSGTMTGAGHVRRPLTQMRIEFFAGANVTEVTLCWFQIIIAFWP
jgi:hypothetical protein